MKHFGGGERKSEGKRKSVNWINLAQDSEKWLDAVNTPMNLRVP
jgi:hypothetical protein